jgi:retinol dehydrogenase 13
MAWNVSFVVMPVPGKAFFDGPVFQEAISMAGKLVLVTGANTGIGLETVVGLAERGAHVILACRDQAKAERAVESVRLRIERPVELSVLSLDLTDLRSVEECAEAFFSRFQRLDVLVNNAGVMRTPHWLTKQGFEIQLGVNHIGHFYLTNLLVPALEASGQARVVHVSSLAHERVKSLVLDDLNWEKRPYQTTQAYEQSKLANVLFSNELNRRYAHRGILSNSLHPGESLKCTLHLRGTHTGQVLSGQSWGATFWMK